jgi:hypothetical protein
MRDYFLAENQCFGSVIFWYGSGSADPCLCPKDPDPDIFVFDLQEQDANKKQFFSKFFCLLLFKGIFHHFSEIKSHKEGTFTSFFYDKKL